MSVRGVVANEYRHVACARLLVACVPIFSFLGGGGHAGSAIFFLILKYVFAQTTTISVSSYYYICVLVLLNVSLY